MFNHGKPLIVSETIIPDPVTSPEIKVTCLPVNNIFNPVIHPLSLLFCNLCGDTQLDPVSTDLSGEYCMDGGVNYL